MNNENREKIISEAWENKNLLSDYSVKECINSIIKDLDDGKLRIATNSSNKWQVQEWIKKAVILYFPTQKMEVIKAGELQFYDKMKLKSNFKELGVRVVPSCNCKVWCIFSKRSYNDAFVC